MGSPSGLRFRELRRAVDGLTARGETGLAWYVAQSCACFDRGGEYVGAVAGLNAASPVGSIVVGETTGEWKPLEEGEVAASGDAGAREACV
jgi:hypothetical protein